MKENKKLKISPVLFLHEKHISVSSFCRGASKVILNDSPFNYGLYKSTNIIVQNRASYSRYYFISNWMCFLWIYSARHNNSALFVMKSQMDEVRFKETLAHLDSTRGT